METILGVSTKYEKIKHNAYWNNVLLDTRFRPEESDISTAINHLVDCKNKPTVALLARKKYKTKNYPEYIKRNLFDLYKSSKSVRKADIAYRENFYSLYPKTGQARKLLIKNESIVLNYVKPIEKTIKRSLIKLLSKF